MILERLVPPTISLFLLLGAAPAAPAQLAVAGEEGEDEVSLAELEEAAKSGADTFVTKAERNIAELKRTYGEDFWTFLYDDGSAADEGSPVMPRPYVVAVERKDNVDIDTLAKEYGEILGYLYRVFFDNFGLLLDLDEIEEPVVVLVYDSEESYKEMRESRPDLALANEEFMAGYYQPGTGILTQWRQPNLWEVMFHEGTHQLVDFATRKWNVPQGSRSPWFQEGFADFMGGHESKLAYSEEEEGFVRTFKLGQFLDHRYSDVQGKTMTGDALPLQDLVHLGFWDFKAAQNSQEGNGANQRLTGMVYSQGWALCMFLNYHQNGRYLPQFHEYMRAEVRGEGGGEKFEEIFYLETDADWEDFEAEYREFLFTGLRQMRLKNRK